MYLLLSFTNMHWTDRLSASNVPQYVIGGLTCIIMLVSLVGNLMVLFAIARSKILQRMNIAWYVSLAIADLGKTIICMPVFIALLFSPDWSLSESMCPVYHCFQMSFELVSILNLTAISLDRVFMITRPLTYQRTVNLTKIMICICTLWIVSFLFSFLQLLWWESGHGEGQQWKSYIMIYFGWSDIPCTYKPPVFMVILDFVIAFVVPMIIMAVSYTKIFLVVHSQMRRLKLKRRTSDVVNEDASDQEPEQYSQIPAITKSVDAVRANTTEERIRYSTAPPLPSRSSFAIAPSELARITEVAHESSSSPSARSRTATDESTKSKPDANAPQHQRFSDISVVDIEENDEVQNSSAAATTSKASTAATRATSASTEATMNSNNNAKSTSAKPKDSPATNVEKISQTKSRITNPPPPATNSNNNVKTTSAKSKDKDAAKVGQVNPETVKIYNTSPVKHSKNNVKATSAKLKDRRVSEVGKIEPGTDQNDNPSTSKPTDLKARPNAKSTRSKSYGDVRIEDLDSANVQLHPSASRLTNPNTRPIAKSTSSKSNYSHDIEIEDLETAPVGQDTLPSVSSEPQPVHRRSSLKKAKRDSIISTKRVSVQFQLYPEEQQAETPDSRPQTQATSSRKTKTKRSSNLVLEDETTTSEAVTTTTWLSGSSGERSRVVRQPSEEHMQAWATRHFSDGAPDISYSTVTRPSLAESSGSLQTWNSMIQRRRKSLQRIRENKAVRMTFVVIGAFVLCWLPFEVLFLIKQFCPECVTDTTWQAATMIAYSASAINPFIYNFYSREFRRALKRALCCEDNVVVPWM